MDEADKLVKDLTQSGLSPKAALVYAFLLKEGGAYPSAIAAKTRLNRSTVYKVLAELTIQGLVNEIERGKKLYYTAENPSRIVRFASRKAETAKDAAEHAEQLLPNLLELFEARGAKPRMRYFEGQDAVLSIYEDHIAKTKPYEMLAIANSTDVLSYLPEQFYRKFRKRKVELGITTRGLIPESEASRGIISGLYSEVPKRFQPVVRYLPAGKFPLSGEIVIYRTDRVSIVEVGSGHISGIIVEGAGFNAMMRSIFELAWVGAKER